MWLFTDDPAVVAAVVLVVGTGVLILARIGQIGGAS
jgi:hypothetical protein